MQLSSVFLFLLSLSLLLLMSGCVNPPIPAAPGQPVAAPPVTEQNNTPSTPSTVTPPVAAPCANSANILQRDACFQGMAVQTGSRSWCDRIYSADTQDACLQPFTAADASLCGALHSPALQQTCFWAAAHRLQDTNYCVRLSNESQKNTCMRDVSPPCSFESTPEATELCLALNKSDYNLCNSNLCFFNYGVQRTNLSACDMISGEQARQLACRALVQNDSARCQDSGLSPVADYCYQLAAYVRGSPDWCDFGTTGSPYRNACYLHFAVNFSNPSICTRAEPETGRDDCYLGYSLAADAPAVCPKVVNSLNRNKCYIDTAKQNGDAAACNGLYYGDQKVCYNLVLTGPVPISGADTCRDVSDDLWRDKCYLALAQQENNPADCAPIVNPDYIASCQSRFS